MDVLGNCKTCDGDSFYIPTESAIFVALLVAILLASVVFVIKRKRSSQSRLHQFRQRKHISKASNSTVGSTNALVAAQTNKDHWFYRARTKAKIMLSFAQILTR